MKFRDLSPEEKAISLINIVRDSGKNTNLLQNLAIADA